MSAAQAQVQGAARAQGECKFFSVEVPDAWTYTDNFVSPTWLLSGIFTTLKAFEYTAIKTYVDKQARKDENLAKMLTELKTREGWSQAAYVKAFCSLANLKTALLIDDETSDNWDVVVFDLSEDEIRKIIDEMTSYANTVREAYEKARDDDKEVMESCVYLTTDKSVDECLAKAKEILAKA